MLAALLKLNKKDLFLTEILIEIGFSGALLTFGIYFDVSDSSIDIVISDITNTFKFDSIMNMALFGPNFPILALSAKN